MPQRYPENTTASIEDFRRSGWRAAIDASNGQGYSSIWWSLYEAAIAAIESGDNPKGKVLWLLADACSMIINPESPNEPLKPIFVTNGQRSLGPEDFQASEVELLAQIAEEVSEPWLQARLADIAWLLLRNPRSPKHALLAIDAYRTIPLDKETWLHGGQECWKRAINLARTLGASAGAGERIREIEADLLDAFNAAEEKEDFFALWLSNLLFDSGLAHAEGQSIYSFYAWWFSLRLVFMAFWVSQTDVSDSSEIS